MKDRSFGSIVTNALNLFYIQYPVWLTLRARTDKLRKVATIFSCVTPADIKVDIVLVNVCWILIICVAIYSRISQKLGAWISIVFYCSENSSITHGPRFRWGFSKMYLSKWALQPNRKLKMSHVWFPTDFPRSHHILVRLAISKS